MLAYKHTKTLKNITAISNVYYYYYYYNYYCYLLLFTVITINITITDVYYYSSY